MKSVHVKRHLTSNHGVANPLQWLEDQVCFSQDDNCDPFLQLPFFQGEQVRKVMAGVVDLDEEERLDAGGVGMVDLEEEESMQQSEMVDLEEGNQDDDEEEEEEEEVDYNNSNAEGLSVDISNENSQEKFEDFEEKVPPLRIKLPTEAASKSPVAALDSTSNKLKPELTIGAHKVLVGNLDSEEDDEADDQLEIIDENTIGRGEEDLSSPIGVIINESNEDAEGSLENGGDRLADKDDLEEILHD